MTIICVSCGKEFRFGKKKQQIYSKKGFKLPKHCGVCQKQRKAERESPYYGLSEAFSNYAPCKKRHLRVHYAPYITGGMR